MINNLVGTKISGGGSDGEREKMAVTMCGQRTTMIMRLKMSIWLTFTHQSLTSSITVAFAAGGGVNLCLGLNQVRLVQGIAGRRPKTNLPLKLV